MAKKAAATSDERRQNDPSIWYLRTNRIEAAKALVQWSDETILANGPRASRVYLYSSAFEGYTLTSLNSFGCDVRSDLTLEGLNVPVYVNRIKALSKAFVAKTGANDDPVPQFVTNGGDFEQRQAAEDMDGVVCSEYESQHGGYADLHGLFRKLELMITTALGRGWVFVFPGCYGDKWKPEAEIDDGLTIGLVREHQYGRVIGLVRSSWRDPEHLIAKHGAKHKAAILKNVDLVQPTLNSGVSEGTANTRLQPTQRLVRVIMGWHISGGPKDPGREMFALKDGHVLEDNEWDRAAPPGRHIDYEEELSAGGGTPLTHSIYRMFCRENELIGDADNLERNTPMETWLVQRGTQQGGEIKSQLESARGINIVEVTGDVNSAAKVADHKGLPRKTMELLDLFGNLQHEASQISRGHSDATQAAHISSGIQASLEASLFPEVHADFVMRFNRFRAVDVAELFVWAIQDIVGDGKKYETWAGDAEVRRLVRGDKLDLDLSKYRIQVKSASARKDSVSTRLQKAERWLVDPKVQFTGSDMAQFWKTYDVNHKGNQLAGIVDGVEKQLRKWRKLPLPVAEAQWRSPAKYMTIDGLESALLVVVADYEDARDSNIPEPRLRLWEQYMDQCVSLIRALRLDEARLQAEAQRAALGGQSGEAIQPGAPGGAAGAGG